MPTYKIFEKQADTDDGLFFALVARLGPKDRKTLKMVRLVMSEIPAFLEEYKDYHHTGYIGESKSIPRLLCSKMVEREERMNRQLQFKTGR